MGDHWRQLSYVKRNKICRKVNLYKNQVIFYNLFNKLFSSFWKVLPVGSLWVWERKLEETEPFADQCIRHKILLRKSKQTTWEIAWGTAISFISSKTWSFRHRTIGIGRTLRRLFKYVCTETVGYGTAYLIQKKKRWAFTCVWKEAQAPSKPSF